MSATYYRHQKPTIPAGTPCNECTQPAQIRVTLPMFDTIHLCGGHFDARKAELDQTALAVEDDRNICKGQSIPESVIVL